MERPTLAPRSEQPLRCAYCHADAPEALLGSCAGCGALTHAECRGDGCPTLGCVEAAYVAPKAQVRPDRVRRTLPAAERGAPTPWEQAFTVLVGAALVATVAALLGQALAGGDLRAEAPRPLSLILGTLGAVLGLGFMAFLQRRQGPNA